MHHPQPSARLPACAGVNRKLRTIMERLHPKDSARRTRGVAEDQGECAVCWLGIIVLWVRVGGQGRVRVGGQGRVDVGGSGATPTAIVRCASNEVAQNDVRFAASESDLMATCSPLCLSLTDVTAGHA